jgi:exosortase
MPIESHAIPPRDRVKPVYLVVAAVLVLLTILVQHRAWHDIFSIAINDQDSSHILLVPMLVAWLIYVRRLRWRECRLTGRWLGPVILLLGAATSNFGVDHGMAVFWHFGSLLMAIGAVTAVLGTDIFRKFFPAFLMLMFLVPVPATIRQDITVPLEHFSALLSQQALEIVGVTVSRAGNVLIVNGVKVEIAEACDGMRMAIALMVLVATFTLSTPMNRWARAIFLILSPVVALACNIIRLVPTVWVFGKYPHAAAESFHNAAGWLMLPVAFLLFWSMLRLLRWASVPVAPYGLAYE